MDPRQQILDKVRKLLALSESPSEEEAAAALEKARTLLARYGLTMAEVKEEHEVTEELLLEKKRMRKWESALVSVVCQASFTQPLLTSSDKTRQLLLIGREVNVANAKALFTYLHQRILIMGRGLPKSASYHVDSYRQGIVHRLAERLAQSAAQGDRVDEPSESDRQLVVQMSAQAYAENSDYISGKYGKLRSKKVRTRIHLESYDHGREAAESIHLNRQIKST